MNGRRESVRVEYGRQADQETADGRAVKKRNRKARGKKSATVVPPPDFNNMIRMSTTPPDDPDVTAPENSHFNDSSLVSSGQAVADDLSGNTQSVLAVNVLAAIDADAFRPTMSPHDPTPGLAEEMEGARRDNQCDVPSAPVISMIPSFKVVEGISIPSGYTLVDDKIIQLFRNRGMPTPEAVNGPGNGSPRYVVRISDVQSLRFDVEAEESQSDENQSAMQTNEDCDLGADNGTPVSPAGRKRKATTTGAAASRPPKKARHSNRTVENAVTNLGNRTLRSQTQAKAHDGVRTRTSGKPWRQATKKK